MDCTAQFLPYDETGAFSAIVADYLRASDILRPFYTHPVSPQGLRDAIGQRVNFPTDRTTLVDVLEEQYQSLAPAAAVQRHLALLRQTTTFTITTAHQPNIFTGHLFFVYKILHTIRLAAYAKDNFPEYDFVPVYFMGSEDADLDELGHINVGGEKLEWHTPQTGAVGRMSPQGLEKIIERLEGEFGGLPHGPDMVALIKKAYLEHATIQEATLYLVHTLFAQYGLIVLIPDDVRLKRLFLPVFRRELSEGFSHTSVVATTARLGKHYKVQAAGREINLFYFTDRGRHRIVREGDFFKMMDTDLSFSREDLWKEMEEYPERFSPNVILRGVFQELILPGVAFIGGGGELAYWLELKDLFEAARVPYPVLVLRNSFMLVEQRYAEKATQLGIPLTAWFAPSLTLINDLVRRETHRTLTLDKEKKELGLLYDRLSKVAREVDTTFQAHVAALQSRSITGLDVLEKKLLKAEREHFVTQERQIDTIKNALFPGGALQERVENIMPYYAKYGPDLIRCLYDHSVALDQQFCILTLTT